MKKIPMLERFAAQSLVESDGELIFSKEKFAELIVRESAQYIEDKFDFCGDELIIAEKLKEHFGVDE